MDSPVLIALVSAIGGTSFGGVILALFARRKTAAEADVTVGEAWQKFVATQAAETAELKRFNAELRGELRAAQADIAKLQRQENDSLYWAARVVQRDEIVASLLNANGIKVPPMPEPPAARQRLTRSEDRRYEGEDGGKFRDG